MTGLAILWRGPLSSCNYDCPYCPFAKRPVDRAELAADEAALARFVGWARDFGAPLSVFFTPWGEALVHRHYQRALIDLSALPHVRRVAIQTNLSMKLGFLRDCDPAKVGLWSTYHPGETPLGRFVAQVRVAVAAGARLSAGVVGQPDAIGAIEALRAALPPDVYVWVNRVRGVDYNDAEVARLVAVDPLFRVNLDRPYPSAGRPCLTGERVVSVDGAGDVRRCHFVDDVLGNLYDPRFREVLRPRPCPNESCRCHIGYVHLPELGLYDVFGDGVLERIPNPAYSQGQLRAS